MTWILPIGERVVVFDHGKILADGKTQDIFGQEQVLRQAHLKKPQMLKVYEVLLERGAIQAGSRPRRAEELADCMGGVSG